MALTDLLVWSASTLASLILASLISLWLVLLLTDVARDESGMLTPRSARRAAKRTMDVLAEAFGWDEQSARMKADRRRRSRDRLFVRSFVHVRGERVPCMVVDLSAHGAQIRPEKEIADGEEVALEAFEYGLVSGTIVRRDGPALGIAFKHAIPF